MSHDLAVRSRSGRVSATRLALPAVFLGCLAGAGSADPLRSGNTDVALDGMFEPTIAVNPTNPLNLAYASMVELRVTTDGGANWQPPVLATVPSTHYLAGDPCLTFDSQGRLFWTYLSVAYGDFFGGIFGGLGADMFVAQCDPATGEILPGYPVNVSAQLGLPGSAGYFNDKDWIAADANPTSPFADRLHVVWTLFPSERATSSFSTDQGATWSSPLYLSTTGSFFKWPVHVAVAANGDVYVAEHRQTFVNGYPSGTTGHIRFYRSTDGGVSFPQQTTAFAPGTADMTFNRQTTAATIPGAQFLLMGSVQPWILPDPVTSGTVHIVASDDPDNDPTSGDAANVYIATSTDHGVTWGAPTRIDSGPESTFQVMPTASIDRQSGAIVVHYYDNRNGALNADGNYLLDVFATISLDGGNTFRHDFRINDAPFDPQVGASCRYNCGTFFYDTWASSAPAAFAVGTIGRMTKWNGASWTDIATGVTDHLYGVWGNSPSDVFICGSSGTILRYDGAQVTSDLSGIGKDLFGIDGRAANDVYAVGEDGSILHYDGTGWASMASPTVDHLYALWANPSGDAFAVGADGNILRHNGLSWTPMSSGTVEALVDVWGTSDANIYAVGINGGLYRFDGAVWDSSHSGLHALHGVWGSAANDVYVVGWGQILHFDGAVWSPQSFTEKIMWKIHGSGASNVFTVGEHGLIGRFDGASWAAQDNPGLSNAATERIGEYNGVAVAGGSAFAVWCGNTFNASSEAVDQQTIFDTFMLDTPKGVLTDALETDQLLILEPGAPNPLRSVTTFAYSVPREGRVRLSLHDVMGRLVTVLADGPHASGRHVASWKARDAAGAPAAAGIYFLRLEAGGEVRTQKVVLGR